MGKRMGRPPIDLTGETYGELTCLSLEESLPGRSGAVWRVRCSCGRESTARAAAMRQGLKTYCGDRVAHGLAKAQADGGSTIVELVPVGARYGRLTVVGRTFINKYGRRIFLYECKCDCGKTTTSRKWDLEAGRKQSCGCYKRDWRRERDRAGRALGQQSVPAGGVAL